MPKLVSEIHKLEKVLDEGTTISSDKIGNYVVSLKVPRLSYKDIKNLPFLTKYPLGVGMWGWRIPIELGNDSLCVVCEFRKGSILKLHDHDCWEKTTIIKGKCIVNMIDDKLVYDEGSLIIPPETIHSLEFLADSRLLVEFSQSERL